VEAGVTYQVNNKAWPTQYTQKGRVEQRFEEGNTRMIASKMEGVLVGDQTLGGGGSVREHSDHTQRAHDSTHRDFTSVFDSQSSATGTQASNAPRVVLTNPAHHRPAAQQSEAGNATANDTESSQVDESGSEEQASRSEPDSSNMDGRAAAEAWW
jgi:hypothetical protein